MIRSLVLLLLCPAISFGETAPLLFSARIQDERLAEEAIELLQCLADRAGTGWELADTAAGSHWVRVEEKGKQLVGEYVAEGKRHPFSLGGNGWRQACDQLRPISVPAATAPPLPSLPELAPEPERSYSPWWWAGAAGLAVGGFILWRQRAARHPGIQMN
jgi:hypothetical protein